MIYLSRPIAISEGVIWEACNGATRQRLLLIAKGLPSSEEEVISLECRVGFLNKGKHSFIFLNPGHTPETLGLFLCRDYGYTVVSDRSPKGACLFEASSVGGYGNSESKFGIYRVGTVIAVHSYKHRQGDSYWRLNPDGWVNLGKDVPLSDEEITYL